MAGVVLINYFLIILTCWGGLSLGFVVPNESSEDLNASPYAADLVKDLQDLFHLIPKKVIDEIAAEHFLTDLKFVKAATFIDSENFKELLKQVEEVKEVQKILAFLHLIKSVDKPGNEIQTDVVEYKPKEYYEVDDLSDLEPYLEILLLEVLRSDKTASHTDNLKSFTSYVNDVLEYLPKDKYVAMINEKRKLNPNFNEFYLALRSPEFKSMLESTLKSKGLSGALKTLSDHEIDVPSLKTIVFKLISWGPIP